MIRRRPREADLALDNDDHEAVAAAIGKCRGYTPSCFSGGFCQDGGSCFLPEQSSQTVTDADVEAAWAEMIGPDVAAGTQGAHITRADLRSALLRFATGKSRWLTRKPSAGEAA